MVAEPAQTAVPERWRFTVDEYHRMAGAGILGEEDRVELIDGELVRMSPIGDRHAAAVKRSNALFSARLAGRALVGIQDPVELSDRTEPQPDLSLLRPRPDFYSGRTPGPGDVLLLVEVADTSLEYDRGLKAGLYARSGIAELWLLDLVEEVLEVCRDPGPRGYGDRRRFRPGERVASLDFPDLDLDVADVLPPPAQSE